MLTSRTRAVVVFFSVSAFCVPAFAQAPPAPFIGQNFESINSATTNSLGNTAFEPPDPNGAVGLKNYVQFNNGSFTVFRKDGTKVQQMNAGAFFTAAGISVSTNNVSDPHLLYDYVNQRWIACMISTSETTNNRILIARSDTNDPTGTWKAVAVTANTITESGGSGSTRFGDFPTLGMTNQNVAIGTLNFTSTGALAGTISLYNIPKADLYAATPTTANLSSFDRSSTSGAGPGFVISPTVNYSATSGPAMPVLGNLSAGGSNILRTTLSGVGGAGATFTGTAAAPSTTIAVTSYSTPPNAQQPSPNPGGHTIDTGDDRISASSIQQGNLLYSVFGTSLNSRSAIRFTVVNEANNGVVFQTTLAESGADYFYPSVGVNNAGDVVIGFGITRTSSSNPNMFAGGAVITGSTADFSTWNFNTATVLVSGQAAYTGSRWGDFSTTTPDPADPGQFWTTQEFETNDGATRWATQASEIILPKTGEVRWKSAASGTYATATNWFGGVAPGATDHVIISRQSATNYTLTMPSASTTADRLSVRQGPVTVSIPSGGSFTLANTGTGTPSLSVVEFAGDGSLTVTGGGTLTTQNALVAGLIGGTGTLTITGAGTTWTNAGNVTVGGTATASGGTGALAVQSGANATIGGTLTLWRSDAAVNVSGGSTLAVAALTNAAGTNPTVTIGTGSTVQVAPGGGATFSGFLAGAGQFVKDGAGNFTLTGANTLAGNVVINAGTLALSGSGSVAASPVLQVGAGATFDVSGLTGGANFDGARFRLASNQTLRGGGTVQGSVAVAATSAIAPGTPSTPAALTITSDLVMSPTGAYTVKLNGATPGTGYDQVLVNGAVNLVNPNLNVSLGGGYTPAATDKLFILVKSGTNPIVGQFNSAGEGATITITGGFQATISYVGDSGTGQLVGGNDVVLFNFAPVPEPGTVLGLSAMVLFAVRVVRRRAA
jgi:autotransporter-associated beta strand protein/T5SS/PEP-CTERM-associated repeat protein